MTTVPATPVEPSRGALWTGRVLSAIPALMLAFSAVLKLTRAAPVLQSWPAFGFSESTLLPIGLVELLVAVLFVLPPTSVLGAILVVGYLGGATATHVRAGQPFFPPVLLGVLAWLDLYLRDPRLRALLPLRSR